MKSLECKFLINNEYMLNINKINQNLFFKDNLDVIF